MEKIGSFAMEEIVTGIPGGFFIYESDEAGTILYVNDEVLRLFGCDSKEEFFELTGNTFSGMILKEDVERVQSSIALQIRESGSGMDYVEYRIKTKTGEIRWVEDYGHFVRNKGGHGVFYVFISDITERIADEMQQKRQMELLAEERKMLQRALESTIYSYVEIYMVDFKRNEYHMIYPDSHNAQETGDYTAAIDRHVKTGRILEEEEGCVACLLHPQNVVKALREEDSVEFQYRRKLIGHKQPEWCATVFTIVERVGGKPLSATLTIRSIEHIIQKEQQQRRLLEDALEQARRANRAKSTFLSNMSHDIRTPMTAIMGFTTLAELHLDNKEQVRKYLKEISASSSHLLSLINDVLDMSWIESGKIHIDEQACNLTEILCDLRNMMEAEVSSGQLDFFIDTIGVKNENIFCDKLRLNQIMINLLSNAFKFTKPGGTVSMRIAEKPGVTEEYGNYEFRVKDTGIGIKPEFLDHVFEPFERESNTTLSGVQGAGLGLAITKNVVDMMGGTIKVTSEPGKGTEFVVNLMLRLQDVSSSDSKPVSHPADQESSLQQEKHWAGKRILLVDDNDINREIASELLGEAGFVVDEAENGAVAVEKVAKTEPGYYSAVLMDIQMPVMDGYTAARKIRSLGNTRLSMIPVLAMTANAFDEDRRAAYDAGMNAHIAKPVDVEVLIRHLAKFL